MKRPLPPLGDVEYELLTVLWNHGPMTASAVRKRLARVLKDPTVRTVLRRLEEKGYVIHKVDAGTFIFHAKESAESAAASAVKRIIDKFCNGSIERALAGLVEAAVIDPKQLATIAGKLKRKP